MTRSFGAQIGMAVGALALTYFTMTGPVIAGNPLSGDGIKAMMSDATVEGKMNDGTSYSEFYEADGKIKAKEYAGRWTIEGSTMCFVYSTKPQKMCYQIGQGANGIEWIRDGKVQGTGTVVKGNVRQY